MMLKKILAALVIVSAMTMFSATALYTIECLQSSVDNPKGPFSLTAYCSFAITTITYAFHIVARRATYSYEGYSLFKQSLCCGLVALMVPTTFIYIVYEVTLDGLLLFTSCFVINNSLIPYVERYLFNRLDQPRL